MDWPLLGSLDDAARREILQIARRRKYPKGTAVFWEGDPGAGIHLVAKGHIAIQLTTRRGDVATVRVIGPSQYFGELALISTAPRSATAMALDAVETLTVHRDDFELLRASHPAVTEVIVDALATEVRRVTTALLDALYLDADHHLWRRLDDLATAFGDGTPGNGAGAEIVLPVTQATLASLAGVTRQTAHAFLADATEKGIVRADKRGSITIVDRERLADLARASG